MFGVQGRVVAGITLRATIGRKRALLFALAPLVLVLVTVALKLAHPERASWPVDILGVFGLTVVLPLTALIIGTSVLGAEIDDGSIVHLLATPVSRTVVIGAKYAVACVLTMIFAAIPILVAGLIATGGATRLAVGVFVGALAGSVMYNAVFVMISAVTTRAIAWGLLYALIWEGVLGNLVAGARLLSVGQYSLGIANSIARDPSLNAALGLSTAVVAGRARDRRRAGHRGQQAGVVLAQGRAGLSRPRRPGCGGAAGRQRGVSGPGRKAGPWPGTITVATARMRSLLLSSAAWSAPSGSTAGPSGPHQACVQA